MNCIVCDQTIKTVEIVRYEDKEYPVCHCINCDLKFYRDLRETPLEYYEKLYTDWNVEGISLRGLVWGHRRFFEILNSKSEIRKGGFTLLDVGCAEGLFVREAQRRGIDAYGIDINPRLVKIAHNKYSGDGSVFHSKLEDLEKHPWLPQRYHIITMVDVLEHLHNPRKFLEEVKKRLHTGGWVFISLPNRNANPRLLPIDGDLPPHHLTWWSEKSLRFLIESTGFETIEYAQEPVNPRDMAVWFDYLLTRKLPLLGAAKSSVQQKGFASEDKSGLRFLYRLKKLELDLLSAGFFLPAWLMSRLGYNGTAQIILAQRK